MICTDFRNLTVGNPFDATVAERAAIRSHYKACEPCRRWIEGLVLAAAVGLPPEVLLPTLVVGRAAAAALLAHDATDPEVTTN